MRNVRDFCPIFTSLIYVIFAIVIIVTFVRMVTIVGADRQFMSSQLIQGHRAVFSDSNPAEEVSAIRPVSRLRCAAVSEKI